MGSIRGNASQITGKRSAARFRTSLATAQIALSMTLLGRALPPEPGQRLAREPRPPPRQPRDVRYCAGRRRILQEQSRALFERVEAELSVIPGVAGVTSTAVQILAGNNWGQDVSVQGLTQADSDNNSRTSRVGTDYFRTLEPSSLPDVTSMTADNRNSTPVAIVNETFAKKFKLGADAVGKFMAEGNTDSLTVQIVGWYAITSTAT